MAEQSLKSKIRKKDVAELTAEKRETYQAGLRAYYGETEWDANKKLRDLYKRLLDTMGEDFQARFTDGEQYKANMLRLAEKIQYHGTEDYKGQKSHVYTFTDMPGDKIYANHNHVSHEGEVFNAAVADRMALIALHDFDMASQKIGLKLSSDAETPDQQRYEMTMLQLALKHHKPNVKILNAIPDDQLDKDALRQFKAHTGHEEPETAQRKGPTISAATADPKAADTAVARAAEYPLLSKVDPDTYDKVEEAVRKMDGQITRPQIQKLLEDTGFTGNKRIGTTEVAKTLDARGVTELVSPNKRIIVPPVVLTGQPDIDAVLTEGIQTTIGGAFKNPDNLSLLSEASGKKFANYGGLIDAGDGPEEAITEEDTAAARAVLGLEDGDTLEGAAEGEFFVFNKDGDGMTADAGTESGADIVADTTLVVEKLAVAPKEPTAAELTADKHLQNVAYHVDFAADMIEEKSPLVAEKSSELTADDIARAEHLATLTGIPEVHRFNDTAAKTAAAAEAGKQLDTASRWRDSLARVVQTIGHRLRLVERPGSAPSAGEPA